MRHINEANFLHELAAILQDNRSGNSRSLIFQDKTGQSFIGNAKEQGCSLKKVTLDKIILKVKSTLAGEELKSCATKPEIGKNLFSRAKKHFFSGFCGFFRKIFNIKFEDKKIGKELIELKVLEEQRYNELHTATRVTDNPTPRSEPTAPPALTSPLTTNTINTTQPPPPDLRDTFSFESHPQLNFF